MAILSLGNSTLSNATPLDVIKAAAAGGFDAAGIRLTGRAPGDGAATIPGNTALIRDLVRQRADSGIAITHATAYWVTPELALSAFLPVIDAAAELGAGTLVVNCGDPEESRFVAFMAAYCEAAAACRVKLALEFMPYSESKSLEQAVRMIKRTGQPNFGLMVDALHLARCGGTPADVAQVEPELLYMVQICDAPLQAPPASELRNEALCSRLYPGEGGLPLHELLNAVPRDLQVDAEVPCRAHAALPPEEQARRTGAACRRFLAAHARRTEPPPMNA